jgi:hypothetical protein
VTLNELLRDRGRLFWILNISGWVCYMLAAWLGALAHEKPESYFAVIAAVAVAGFLITLLLRAVNRRLWSRSPATLAMGLIASCYVTALGWRWLTNVLYYDWVKNNWQPEHLMDYVGGVMGSFYILLCWSGLYFGIKYYQQLQEQTEQTLKATAAAHQAQLKMLRYQLNPHFLFNTLNAISTLILDGANETANSAVSRLSDFLRYTLDNDPMSRVPGNRESPIRRSTGYRESGRGKGARCAGTKFDTATHDRKCDQICHLAKRGWRYDPHFSEGATQHPGAAIVGHRPRAGKWQ